LAGSLSEFRRQRGSVRYLNAPDVPDSVKLVLYDQKRMEFV